MSIAQISMLQLHEKLGALGKNEIVLDVRTPAEFQAGHVPGSRNIPHDGLGPYLDELRQYHRIYLHCRSGKRAMVASELLQSAGLTNFVCISGSGMEDWVAAGYPVAHGPN